MCEVNSENSHPPLASATNLFFLIIKVTFGECFTPDFPFYGNVMRIFRGKSFLAVCMVHVMYFSC